MTSRFDHSDELAHFLYRSTAREDLDHDDIGKIVDEAVRRNRDLGITGCLHYEDGLFFQWLEGPRAAVDLLTGLIFEDPRHAEISALSSGPLPRRQFAGWTMRSSNRSHASLMDWVAAQNVSTIDRGAYAGTISAFLMAITV